MEMFLILETAQLRQERFTTAVEMGFMDNFVRETVTGLESVICSLDKLLIF